MALQRALVNSRFVLSYFILFYNHITDSHTADYMPTLILSGKESYSIETIDPLSLFIYRITPLTNPF